MVKDFVMEFKDIKDAKFINENGDIDCMVNFSHLEEEYVPFTARKESTGYEKEIYNTVMESDWGEIEDYIPTVIDPDEIEKAETLNSLALTDAGMIRVIEDIYAVLNDDQKAMIPEASKEKIVSRETLRKKLCKITL